MTAAQLIASYDPVPEEQVLQSVKDSLDRVSDPEPNRILPFIDHTSLNNEDYTAGIRSLCEAWVQLYREKPELPWIPALCVFPPYVREVRDQLRGTPIRVASVAAGFPTGQTFLSTKLQEVEAAVEAGAQEIDMVIHRGHYFGREWQALYDEISAIREACGKKSHLKVILEVSELPDLQSIQQVSWLACHAGADFIKTSTGKGKHGATPESAAAMAWAIYHFRNQTGRTVGLKVAGGISDLTTAEQYRMLAEYILGGDFIHPDTFRIGASRLTNALLHALGVDVSRYFHRHA